MLNKAVFGGGCFWCTEALFQRLKGVQKVQSGYAGGKMHNPTYKKICTGETGHAEVIRVYYNSSIITYQSLIYIFLNMHDPTVINAQGYDKGTQYRSIILYQNLQQKKVATETIDKLTKQGGYPGSPSKIVTQLKQLQQFYIAQQQHQNYYNENTNQGYCKMIINPKIHKLGQLFQKYLPQSKI